MWGNYYLILDIDISVWYTVFIVKKGEISMHYLTKRTNTVKEAFSGMSKNQEYITPQYLDEWMTRFEGMCVVAYYTVFTETIEGNETHEQQTWVDPEGLDFGWRFINYRDERDNIKYKDLAQSFKEDFYKAVKGFKDGKYADMFVLRGELYDDTFFVFFISGYELQEGEESINEVFTLTTELLNGLR